jgi:hypothetical protein
LFGTANIGSVMLCYGLRGWVVGTLLFTGSYLAVRLKFIRN